MRSVHPECCACGEECIIILGRDFCNCDEQFEDCEHCDCWMGGVECEHCGCGDFDCKGILEQCQNIY